MSVLTLARTIGLTAVAEGVETEQHARQLRALGCPLGQGYVWCRPAGADTIDDIYHDGLPSMGRAQPRKRGRPNPDNVLVSRASELLARGASLHTIAAALNAGGERTESGSRWHASSVARLIAGKKSWPTRKE
jgi:hypothetical protein